MDRGHWSYPHLESVVLVVSCLLTPHFYQVARHSTSWHAVLVLRSAFFLWHTKYLGLAKHAHTTHPRSCKPWGIIRERTVSQSMGMEGKGHLRRQSAEGSGGCGPGHEAMPTYHISQERGLSVITILGGVWYPLSHTPGRGQYQGWGFRCH